MADKEQFVSRYIETAPQKSTIKVNQHLLDGQQRLTAFWRAIHNNYEFETYYIYIFPNLILVKMGVENFMK